MNCMGESERVILRPPRSALDRLSHSLASTTPGIAERYQTLRLLEVLRLRGRSAPMMPRATTPATVRVSGEFMTFSKVDGSGLGARPPGRAGAGPRAA